MLISFVKPLWELSVMAETPKAVWACWGKTLPVLFCWGNWGKFCFVPHPHKPRSSSCFLSLKFPAFLSYNSYHSLPCSPLQQLQSFSGIIIIIELTPGPIPRAISWLRGPSRNPSRKKKTQEREEEGREGLYTGRKDNRLLLWHGLWSAALPYALLMNHRQDAFSREQYTTVSQ